jgi:MinD-like ATPase involved in chromosome partitioning or flagellar assembly
MRNAVSAVLRRDLRIAVHPADMRRPGLSTLMGLKGQSGLTDVLNSTGDMADVARQHVRTTSLENLDILPAGPRRPNPAELLSAGRLIDLLAWAEGLYDQILIDSDTADVLEIGFSNCCSMNFTIHHGTKHSVFLLLLIENNIIYKPSF